MIKSSLGLPSSDLCFLVSSKELHQKNCLIEFWNLTLNSPFREHTINYCSKSQNIKCLLVDISSMIIPQWAIVPKLHFPWYLQTQIDWWETPIKDHNNSKQLFQGQRTPVIKLQSMGYRNPEALMPIQRD